MNAQHAYQRGRGAARGGGGIIYICECTFFLDFSYRESAQNSASN